MFSTFILEKDKKSDLNRELVRDSLKPLSQKKSYDNPIFVSILEQNISLGQLEDIFKVKWNKDAYK